ncbi:hypothetical protein BJ741DRAFT_566054 [Chytriomyces cf. hyalinus JEL632]|nr:hypothetical protein BJ741DRAFT_566054 [Chytriomyces cf. hyalinus JEL632]
MLQQFSSATDSVGVNSMVDAGTGTFEETPDIVAQVLLSLDMVNSPTADEPPSPTTSHCASSPLSMSSATSWSPTASNPLPFVFNPIQNPKKRTQIVNSARGRHPCLVIGCTSILKSSGALKQHAITHSGERPFLCQEPGCGKAYTTNNRRKVHALGHLNQRPYICIHPGCSYAATQACSLNTHKVTHMSKEEREEHNRTHAPKFGCNACGKRFKTEAWLEKHFCIQH